MNRNTNQFRSQFEKKVVDVFATVNIGSTGAPTVVTTNSKGILSCSRVSAGLYTFVFGTNATLPKDVYVKLLNVSVTFNSASSAPAAPFVNIATNAIATPGSASIQLQFRNSAGTATDPASGEIMHVDFTFGDSTAP